MIVVLLTPDCNVPFVLLFDQVGRKLLNSAKGRFQNMLVQITFNGAGVDLRLRRLLYAERLRSCEKIPLWRRAAGATLVVAQGGHKGRPYNAIFSHLLRLSVAHLA